MRSHHRNHHMIRTSFPIMGKRCLFILKKALIPLKSLCATFSEEFLNIYERTAKLGRKQNVQFPTIKLTPMNRAFQAQQYLRHLGMRSYVMTAKLTRVFDGCSMAGRERYCGSFS